MSSTRPGSAGRGRLAEVLATRGGTAAPEAPFVIEHREALIYMLCEAAELEHGIMCQYLFAAFSLKTAQDEGLNERRARAVDPLAAARRPTSPREEMLHLALVQQPALRHRRGTPFRPAEPAARPRTTTPPGVHLALVPFSEEALQHFMFLERPEGMAAEGREARRARCTRRCR